VLIDTTQLALERSISGATQRHEALAANIANASTPGYKRVDVDFHGALAAALGSSDAKTALHSASFTTQADGSVGTTQADGGSIDVEAESAKLSANALEQQAAVSVAKTRNAILRSAMGVRPWVSADEHVRRHGDLRERAHRAAPADERDGREPGQR
jgi:flagellar basal-body rod protein FlgB